jgi:hypothetical protein
VYVLQTACGAGQESPDIKPHHRLPIGWHRHPVDVLANAEKNERGVKHHREFSFAAHHGFSGKRSKTSLFSQLTDERFKYQAC